MRVGLAEDRHCGQAATILFKSLLTAIVTLQLRVFASENR